jgi:hypothetical protein
MICAFGTLSAVLLNLAAIIHAEIIKIIISVAVVRTVISLTTYYANDSHTHTTLSSFQPVVIQFDLCMFCIYQLQFKSKL